MSNFNIGEYGFDKTGMSIVGNEKLGKDWPVVYMIHNDEELYIGETQNAYNRFKQHLDNPERKTLKKIKIIFDQEYNKSAILDIEQTLIQLCGADNKYKLQNHNGGQSEKHNYYQREKYINKIEQIWKRLTKLGMTNNSIEDIKNTDLFKYSPYNTLTTEQNEVCKEIIYDIIEKLSNNEQGTSVINGGAGTGKTIILINMIYKLINASKFDVDFSEEDDALTESTKMLHSLKEFISNYGHELKIGYVVPMTSIRKTLKTVFSKTKNGLKASMVIGPFDVFKDDYDVLFVDEAHRLAQYKNIGFRGEFAKNAAKLGKDPKDVTQLDMIIARSKYRVLVYDRNQTVKGSDITNEQFENAIKSSSIGRYYLQTQMRCAGGTLYTDYIKNIFNCTQQEFLPMENYEFKLFDDVNDMVESIKSLDKQYGLCRNAAGYSWEWISKGIKTYEEVKRLGKEDITIGNYKYVWNMTNEEFILSKNAINEIGCIHTLQGYDLNYIGLILGEEIDYNPETNQIEIDLDKFYDKYVKQGCDSKTVENFIINSYKVMMTRGIKGCYVYACNKNMQEYLSRFIKKSGE
ncbi:MAG: DUF2075 domain-containing protein [Acholeplasmatales bacterium]|nr:DUF2075 domain-containing protein [Acholeplasmatales bacterium]